MRGLQCRWGRDAAACDQGSAIIDEQRLLQGFKKKIEFNSFGDLIQHCTESGPLKLVCPHP